MPPPNGTAPKLCVICGLDCSTRARTKDRHGRYYCQPCYEQALQQVRTKAAHTAARPDGRVGAAAAPFPAARPASPRPTPKAAAPPRPPPPQSADILADLAALEAAGTAVEAAPRPCPSCGAALAAGAVFCTGCGYNLRTREKVTTAPAARPAPAKAAAHAGLGNLSGILANPVVLTLVVAAVVLLLFTLAKTNPSLGPVYLIATGLLGLGVGVWMLVSAFSESVGTGVMCLCIPFYALYFVFAKCGNPYLKGAFAVSILASVLRFLLPFEGLAGV